MIHRVLISPELSWAYIIIGILMMVGSVIIEERLSRTPSGSWHPRGVPYMGMLGLRASMFAGALTILLNWMLINRPAVFKATGGDMSDELRMSIHARNLFFILSVALLSAGFYSVLRRRNMVRRGTSGLSEQVLDYADYEYPGNGTTIYDDRRDPHVQHPHRPHHLSRVK